VYVFCEGVFRIATTTQEGADTVAYFPRCDVLTQSNNFPRNFEAEGVANTRGRRVPTFALANVGAINSSGNDADHDLVWPGHRDIDVANIKHIRATRMSSDDCDHGQILPRGLAQVDSRRLLYLG
jgi:hypothetical protein